MLLNSAIEANKVFQLQELIGDMFSCPSQASAHARDQFGRPNDATHYAFRLGPIGSRSISPGSQATLTRDLNGREERFREADLDTIAAGNFTPFHTGHLDHSDSTDSRWDYRSCIGQEAACIDPAQRGLHIPVAHNEPLAFIQTDESFIADHNDVFNDNVSAYLAAVVAEARYKRILDDSSVVDPRLPKECQSDNFRDLLRLLSEAVRERG